MIKLNQPVATLYKAGCYLGEAPFWHSVRRTCLWVDIDNRRLYELNWNNGNVTTWELEVRVSFIIEQEQGHILLGVQGGIVLFNLDDGGMRWLKNLDTQNDRHRCNDGYCDPSGRIWFGVMHMEAKPGAASLYCLHPNLDLQKMIGKLTIPNGIAWSAKQQRLYFVDSSSQDVKAYRFDETSNELIIEKIIVEIPKESGTPDGITLDSEGMLWIALYGGFSVIRCNPEDGAVLGVINLPAPNVTNCCFAGPDLSDLVITTAREHLSDSDLIKYPESGDIFIVANVGAKGIPNYKSGHRLPSSELFNK